MKAKGILGPEGMEAVIHTMDGANHIGLHLGMIASGSWNAGGSWVEPRMTGSDLFLGFQF